ncbi:NAD-dependent epimerase/dehydratase family protein [Roseomonas nepalensis]|uniref:NAD-dependent epimerase/dehydratase family protein n=1 Tax=Muricoccus nepalensis TaxID=1854500 RepID=A0A502GES3_9PROT|nr:hopanoid-associated sugar epimerase [Roseomonas nepalensis]TPG60609.1 NAD-dependent epimerase/dehydratase family protein [Roseomonas nepalensis]
MAFPLRAGDPVLVTGGSGFLGSSVLRALIERGVRARALVRPASPRGNLAGLDCEIVEGDLLDRASLGAALRGVRHLFHVAADYRLWAPDPGAILRVNVDGTRALMGEALAAGVERVVYTSSVAALKVAGATAPVDESAPLDPGEAIGAYKRSKTLAERVVEEMVRQEGLPAVIVNPSTPVGPRDIRPTPTGRMILDAARGKIPAFVDTGLNIAHVDDIAAGHLLAFEHGRVGDRYILGGENLALRDLLAEIARQTGRPAPRIGLPRGPLYPLALGAEAVARLTGKEPLLTVDALRMSRYRMFFTSAKAERDLGYRSRPPAEAVADALAWFRQAGRL